MKKIKIVSFLIVISLIVSLFSGCSLFSASTAGAIYDKYNEIVTKYYDATDQTKSLFNANDKFFIVYKTSNLTLEMNEDNSMFNLLKNEYPKLLYSAMSFFYEYKESLSITSNNFSKAGVNKMWETLLTLDTKIENYKIQKTALENITIINYADPGEYDYSLNIRNSYKLLLDSYNELIKAALDFNLAFERDYIKNVATIEDYQTITQIPNGEVKRISYSGKLYLSEAVYNYYIAYLGGFKIVNDAVVRDDQDLFNSMLSITDSINSVSILDWQTMNENLNTISYYKDTRERENTLLVEKRFYLTAISQYNALKDNTDQASLGLVAEYQNGIALMNENYNIYMGFINNLLGFVTP